MRWALLVSVAAVASTALAYRPFDGTDADVAETGKFELELGPVGYYRIGGEQDLVTPAIVLNYGLMDRVELVLEGASYVGLGPGVPPPRVRILDTQFSTKIVLRKGCLQKATGLSLATELGVLLPQVGGENGIGGSVAGIATQCFGQTVTIHYNGAVSLTRLENLDLFGGAIVEGPKWWPLRPVAELYVEREFTVGTTYSALAGVIWPVAEGLDLDAAVRLADGNDVGVFGTSEGSAAAQLLTEVRAGLTWTFP